MLLLPTERLPPYHLLPADEGDLFPSTMTHGRSQAEIRAAPKPVANEGLADGVMQT